MEMPHIGQVSTNLVAPGRTLSWFAHQLTSFNMSIATTSTCRSDTHSVRRESLGHRTDASWFGSWAGSGLAFVGLAIGLAACAQQEAGLPPDQAYFGLAPPGTQPEVFAPGLVSRADEFEYGSVFSPDGREFFFGVELGHRSEIRRMHFDADFGWSEPRVFIGDETLSANDPAVALDGNRLYYIHRSVSEEGGKGQADLYYAERSDRGWEPGRAVPGSINTDANEFYFSSTDDGEVYFASNSTPSGEPRDYNLHRARWSNGQLQRVEQLSVNTRRYDADPFVAPNGSYLIFASIRRGGLGERDLYVSFRTDTDDWGAPQPIAAINTEGHEFCPFVTADSRFLFFTSREDIYWVSTDVIEELRP